MAWKEFSTREPPDVARATGWVRDLVALHRQRGMKSEQAIEETASYMGCTARRIRQIFYRDGAFRLPLPEIEKYQKRYADFLGQEARELEARASILRARAEEIQGELSHAFGEIVGSRHRGGDGVGR